MLVAGQHLQARTRTAAAAKTKRHDDDESDLQLMYRVSVSDPSWACVIKNGMLCLQVDMLVRGLSRQLRLGTLAPMRSFATGYTINSHDNRTAYVGTESKTGMANPWRFRDRAVIVTGTTRRCSSLCLLCRCIFVTPCPPTVAGGASGIGEQCVREFAWEGAHVAIFDTDEKKGRALAQELASQKYVSFFLSFFPHLPVLL